MDIAHGGSNDSGDEYEPPNNHKRKKPGKGKGNGNGHGQGHRHSPEQIGKLERFFQDFPHPDEAQRMMISRDVGIEPRQVKFWFQNRRTQMKHVQGRSENETLREDNEWLRFQNTTMRDSLKNLMCPLCGPIVGTDEQHRLFHENAMLKHERARLSAIIAMGMENADQELRLGLFVPPPPPAGLFVPPPSAVLFIPPLPPADLLVPPPPADLLALPPPANSSSGTSASGERVNVSPTSVQGPTSSSLSSETSM